MYRTFHRTLCFLGVLATALVLCACVRQSPQKLSPEQQTLQASVQQCSTNATNMNDGPSNSSNPFWNSYFEMCMSSQGYKRADYKHLWY